MNGGIINNVLGEIMKKIKKWLVLAGIILGAILVIVFGLGDSKAGIKQRMKLRKVKMDALKKKEDELKKEIEKNDGGALILGQKIIDINKKKREIEKSVKNEIANSTDKEKAELLGSLLKDL